MKLIAKRDFRNVGRAIEISNPIHPDHIHKGAQFQIGKGDSYKSLTKAEQLFVAQLNAADCVGDGSDEKIVAAVKAECVADKKADTAREALAAAAAK